jgi:drug/metabolite transporter (DMT)-like permease
LVRRAYDFGSSAETVVVFRVGIPAALFLCWTAVVAIRARGVPRCSREVFAFAAAYGLVLLVINFLELEALERVPVALVVLIVALAPLWISLASWFLWGAPLGWHGALAIVFAVAGTALIMGSPSGRLDTLGFLLSLGTSVLSGGLYLLLERKLSAPSPQLVIAIGTGVATITAILIAPTALTDELNSGGSRIGAVVGAGLAGGVALLLILIGIRSSSAFVAGIAIACEPIFAAVLAWRILGETLTAAQLAGGALALVGLGIALSAPIQPRKPLAA